MRTWTFKSLALLLGVGLFLTGVIVLGRLALDSLRRQDRYAIRFADISCNSPPGLSQAEFLDEVQYLASFPDRLHLLDRDLAERLSAAFARHPWVARVERVEVAPPALVRVQLVYRKPALAVKVAGQTRVVDSQGVLLPKGAPAEGLPVFSGKAPPPAGPAGTAWGDRAVEAAARSKGS